MIPNSDPYRDPIFADQPKLSWLERQVSSINPFSRRLGELCLFAKVIWSPLSEILIGLAWFAGNVLFFHWLMPSSWDAPARWFFGGLAGLVAFALQAAISVKVEDFYVAEKKKYLESLNKKIGS